MFTPFRLGNRVASPNVIAYPLPGPVIAVAVNVAILNLTSQSITSGPVFSMHPHFGAMASASAVLTASIWTLYSNGSLVYTINQPDGTQILCPGTWAGSGNPYTYQAFRPAMGSFAILISGKISPTGGNSYSVTVTFEFGSNPDSWDFQATVAATSS